jgi:2-polyprenyl-6-methoxyphenol hydroxylase-like FAD-dependent oxidoreductase
VIIGYIVHKKHNKSVRSGSSIPQHDHAIIIGSGIGGMVTAGYLTKYFKRITIIESDDVLNDTLMKSTPDEMLDYRCRLESPTSLGRSGVSQMYQLHVIESEGFSILQEIFPELKNKLINEYNIPNYSLKTQSQFIVNDVLLNHDLTEDIKWLGIDRFTLETVLRKELCLQFENKIQWKCNSRVIQLIVDQSSNTVKGIKYRCKQDVSSSLIDVYGDFIIDCTGRNSSSIKWLKQSFDLNVPTEEIYFGNGYVTFVGERFKTGDPSLDSKTFMCSTVNAPHQNTAYCISPIREIKTTDENSLGTLSTIVVTCVNSEYPLNDSYENLLDWTKEHLNSGFHSILKSTKVRSPIIPYRRATDYRKYVELLGKKWPQNYIILGDAMCTFNPQYGQGMTHACRHARALKEIFNENSGKLKNLSHIFNYRASQISEECWLISISNDWKTSTLKIVKSDINGRITTYYQGEDFTSTNNNFQARPPFIVRAFQWYNYWFLQCAKESGQLSTDYLNVVSQHKSPYILIKPTTFFNVLFAVLISYFNLRRK